ncbi:hypothetical protein [Vibrio mediterranei]|uniref:hypothetical protein n=1 Tax=Vibrio mediterranei TaxID=689 RepID=UPI00406805D2
MERANPFRFHEKVHFDLTSAQGQLITLVYVTAVFATYHFINWSLVSFMMFTFTTYWYIDLLTKLTFTYDSQGHEIKEKASLLSSLSMA